MVIPSSLNRRLEDAHATAPTRRVAAAHTRSPPDGGAHVTASCSPRLRRSDRCNHRADRPAASASPGAATGPSSSQSPYVVRSQPGVVTKSILTVGDTVGGYRMVGIPDGLGAFDNGDGTFTVLMNHELALQQGTVRAHGANGAFVSKWTIRKDDLSVTAGEDLIHQVATWDPTTRAYKAPATGMVISRLCSADLPLPSALYNSASGKGYNGRIFFDGEEVAGGRAFAHVLDGTSYELPGMGKSSWRTSWPTPGPGTRRSSPD